MNALADAALALAMLLACGDATERVLVAPRALSTLAELPAGLRASLETIERALLDGRAPDAAALRAGLLLLGSHARAELCAAAPASTPCLPPPSSGSEWADEYAAASTRAAETAPEDAEEHAPTSDTEPCCAPAEMAVWPTESDPGDQGGVVDLGFDDAPASAPFLLTPRGTVFAPALCAEEVR